MDSSCAFFKSSKTVTNSCTFSTCSGLLFDCVMKSLMFVKNKTKLDRKGSRYLYFTIDFSGIDL